MQLTNIVCIPHDSKVLFCFIFTRMFDLQANPNHPIYNPLDRENTGIKMKVEKPKKYPVLKDVVLTTDGK